MFDNILGETLYVEKIYGEYISFVNRYQNLNRQSVFCRYYNINKEASTYNIDVAATFDRYNSGIQYDIYNYTPLFYASQLVNDHSDVTDLKGQMFQGSLTVNIYSINKPRIEDIIVFNQPPQDGKEIFRVEHVRASINAMTSIPNANWFELTLEYAPLVDVSKLNLLNEYVYSLPLQKNIFKKEFERQVLETERMNDLFKYLLDYNFDYKKELFYFTLPDIDKKIVPVYENRILYKFLATKSEYQDHFHQINRPFGILDIPHTYNYLDLNTLEEIEDINIKEHIKINPTKDILSQNLPISLFQMVHLIQLWIWERDRLSYPYFKAKDNLIYPDLDKLNPCNLDSLIKCDPGTGLRIDISKLPLNTFKGNKNGT